MTLSRNLFATASAVALLLPVSAFAQLASPVAGGGQSGSASPSGVPQIIEAAVAAYAAHIRSR